MLQFDHAVIAAPDLNAAMGYWGELGFTVTRGGVHANKATHNALITFPNLTYIELLALTGEPPLPGLIDFSVLVRGAEGLVGYALRSSDLEADGAQLRAHGFTVGDILPGERRRADRTLVQWKLALLDGGFAPFLIQDVTPIEHRIDTTYAIHANGAAALTGINLAPDSVTLSPQRAARLLPLFGAASPITLGGHRSPELFGLQISGSENS